MGGRNPRGVADRSIRAYLVLKRGTGWRLAFQGGVARGRHGGKVVVDDGGGDEDCSGKKRGMGMVAVLAR